MSPSLGRELRGQNAGGKTHTKEHSSRAKWFPEGCCDLSQAVTGHWGHRVGHVPKMLTDLQKAVPQVMGTRARSHGWREHEAQATNLVRSQES